MMALPIHKHSIDWDRALGTSLFFVANNRWPRIAIYALRGLIHLALMKSQVPERLKTQFLFFKSITRADYNIFFEQIFAICPFEKKSIDHKYVYAFNFWGVIYAIKNINILLKIFVSRKFRIWASIYIYTNFLRSLQFVESFSNADVKCLIVFGDMQQLDNCLVQYLGQRNCRTVTLQHGLYLDTKDNPANINYVNYMNIVSEYFLSWGEATKNLVERYSKSKVEIVGKPLPPLQVLQSTNSESQFFAVLFDTSVYRSHNKLLKEIALAVETKLSIKAFFFLHPDNDPQEYGLEPSQFLPRSRIGGADFIIGHTTTYLIELMCLGKRAFRLNSDIQWHEISESLTFQNAQDLVDKIMKPATLAGNSNKFIAYIGEDSLNKYKYFFEQLAVDR
jgi:hypothetical protein